MLKNIYLFNFIVIIAAFLLHSIALSEEPTEVDPHVIVSEVEAEPESQEPPCEVVCDGQCRAKCSGSRLEHCYRDCMKDCMRSCEYKRAKKKMHPAWRHASVLIPPLGWYLALPAGKKKEKKYFDLNGWFETGYQFFDFKTHGIPLDGVIAYSSFGMGLFSTYYWHETRKLYLFSMAPIFKFPVKRRIDCYFSVAPLLAIHPDDNLIGLVVRMPVTYYIFRKVPVFWHPAFGVINERFYYEISLGIGYKIPPIYFAAKYMIKDILKHDSITIDRNILQGAMLTTGVMF
jgi:hypothetical protein